MTTISGAVDDSELIKKEEIEAVVRKLSVSYSYIRRSFHEKEREIDAALDGGDVTAAIRLLAQVYRFPKGFVRKVGYSAKIDSPAALVTRFDLTSSCVLECIVCFQDSKAGLLKMPRYRLLHMSAHELAHARMHMDSHHLRVSEFATDVFALLAMGNSRGYVDAMMSDHIQYGYIRRELLDELFRCLGLYADRIYLG